MYFLHKKAVDDHQLNNMRFIKKVLDSMYDWVRVIDMSGKVVFMNRAMRTFFKQHPNHSALQELFETVPIIEEPIRDFDLIAAALRNNEHDKEVKVGNKVYAVISSPLKNSAEKTEYIVEVFRDVTRLKNLQRTITEQNDKFEYDLDMAKMLQRKLLPASSPNAKIDFNYLYKPCDMLGGDFIDMYNIGNDHLGVYIADV